MPEGGDNERNQIRTEEQQKQSEKSGQDACIVQNQFHLNAKKLDSQHSKTDEKNLNIQIPLDCKSIILMVAGVLLILLFVIAISTGASYILLKNKMTDPMTYRAQKAVEALPQVMAELNNQTNQTTVVPINGYCGTVVVNVQKQTPVPPSPWFSNPYEGWVDSNEPTSITDFDCSNTNQNVFSFAQWIPADKKPRQCKILVFYRSINQNPWTDFFFRLRVINKEKQFNHWMILTKFPRDTVILQSQTVTFPCEFTRQVRIKSFSKKSNYLYFGLWFAGYR